MKLISWNVNGIRAVVGKGLGDFVKESNADVYCFQETKMQPGQAEIHFDGFSEYWNAAEKKGYSGTAIFTKTVPEKVTYGIGIEEHDKEGRVITADYGDFYLVNVYTPNSKQGLERLDYRMVWEDAFREYLLKLDSEKPVIICGDLNVAHCEIDLKNPKSNHRNAGFTDEERGKMTCLLESGFCDSFRFLYPDKEGIYSWWSYRFNARANNAGWRIDYFLVSDRIKDKIKSAEILTEIYGSDHCPVSIEIDF